MTKKCIKILDFEDKETKTGKKYIRFKTSEGWMSCFDTKSNEALKKLKGNSANIEIIEQGDFKNIQRFLGPASESVDAKVEKVEKVPQNGLKQEFPKSMKVSYAKDAFCAICSRVSQSAFDNMDEDERLALMDLAIKAVKKAEEAF